MSYKLYSISFEPIVKPGEYIAIPKDDNYEEFNYYIVKIITPIPKLYIPLCPRTDPTINTIEYGRDTEIEDPKEMKTVENELMHTRIKYINFPVEIGFAKGGGLARFTTYSQSHLYITPQTPEEQTEMFWGLNQRYYIIIRPIVKVNIPTGTSYIKISKLYMILYGYRYILKKVTEKPEKYTVIPFEPVK